MKKIIYILFTIQIFIFSLIGFNVIKDNEFNNIFYNNTTSIVVEFKDEYDPKFKYSEWIGNISEKNNVAISKYVFNSNNKITIYTTDVDLLSSKIDLEYGNFPEKGTNQFISNVKNSTNDQSGKFNTLDENTEIIIKELNSTVYLGSSEILHISTIDPIKIDNILDDFSDKAENTRLDETYENLNIYVSPILCKSLLLVFLCFILTLIHYAINRSKEVVILTIHGFTKKDLIIKLCKDLLFIIGISTITGYFVFLIYINKYNMILKISYYYILLSILLIVLNMIVFIIIIRLYIKNLDYIKIIKGKKSYTLINFMNVGLKFIFILFLVISVTDISNSLNELSTKLDNISHWKKTNNLYRINVTYTGEESLSKGEYNKNKKSKLFYDEIVKENNAFIVDATNYGKDNSEGDYYYNLNTQNSLPEVVPGGKSILVNENYLKYNFTKTKYESIKDKVNYNENVLNILVPEELKKYENEIYENYLYDFYMKRVEIENLYNESLNLPMNTSKESDFKVNIIYIDNNQGYFTYNSSIGEDNEYKVYNPIVVLDTGNLQDSYYYSYLTRCVYYYSDSEDPFYDILPSIKKFNLESSIQSVISVYDENGSYINALEKNIYNEILIMAILFISNIMLTYGFIRSYYEKNKYRQYLKRLFGYSILNINSSIISTIILLNIAPIIITKINYLTIIIIAINIIIEIILTMIFSYFLSNKSFNEIIKGEH